MFYHESTTEVNRYIVRALNLELTFYVANEAGVLFTLRDNQDKAFQNAR